MISLSESTTLLLSGKQNLLNSMCYSRQENIYSFTFCSNLILKLDCHQSGISDSDSDIYSKEKLIIDCFEFNKKIHIFIKQY